MASRPHRAFIRTLAVCAATGLHPTVASAGPDVGEASTSSPAFPPPLELDEHWDVSFGLGTQTGGLGVSVGHRSASARRIEASIGYAFIMGGASVAFGFSPVVLESGRTRVEVPVLMSAGMIVAVYGDPDIANRPLFGALTGLDVVHARADGRSGAVFSLRAGAAAGLSPGLFEGRDADLSLAPLAQVALGWVF